MAEFTGEMAVGFRPPSEMPDIAGRDGAKVQRIFTGIEAEGDDAVLRPDAPPELHRLVVAAKGDVAEAIGILS